MYWLMALDALIRIALAILFLFVLVPVLARRTAAGREQHTTLLERFFWNFGVGITLLTLVGQVFTLANLFSLLTILVVAALVILIGRNVRAEVRIQTAGQNLVQSVESAFLAVLNIFDGRVNVRRRIRRRARRFLAALRERTASRSFRLQIAGWVALTAIAFGFRVYRPLATANLGFSDTYVHLYLLKLLEVGRQVDPDWGPYPRGLHFLLMTIHELTNVDEILLLNFFGAFVGVLLTLAVADTARRLSRSVVAGWIAGFIFATLVGGPGQYFVLGGAFGTKDPNVAATLRAVPYRELARGAGDFDLALTAFQRQTSTLPQELAMVMLFPAALFLLDFFRTRQRWYLIGFAGCTAAIAAVHSGVIIPLILMCALILAAAKLRETLQRGTVGRAILSGALAVIVGSAWLLGFIVYPYTGGRNHPGLDTSVPGAALYYFPFLRSMTGDRAVAAENTPIYVTLTPLLIICIVMALLLAIVSFVRDDDRRASRLWIAALFLLFLLMHFASELRLPQIVETARNSQWLLMSIVILGGVAVAETGAAGRLFNRRVATAGAGIATVVLLGAWLARVPSLRDPSIHERIVNYSGYGGSALAVLNIERSLEPYTWTIVSYGQEFPMVLRRGFHLPAADFLDRYDPTTAVVPIPTPDVFVIVEKKAHPFQINTWATRFSRNDLEQRLQTWVQLYQATHSNIRVYLDDENVRVYQIRRTQAEIARISSQAGRR